MAVDWAGSNIAFTQTFNQYAYVINNPLKYIDPMGLKLKELIEGTIKLGEKYINTVYVDGDTGRVYVDFCEVAKAFAGNKFYDGYPKFNIKHSSFDRAGANFLLDRDPMLYLLYQLYDREENPIGKPGTLSITSMGGKYLVDFEYFNKIMCDLGYNNTIVLNTTLEQYLKGFEVAINTADAVTQRNYIWRYIRDNWNLSAKQTSGIMGNLQEEGAFSPTNAEDRVYPGRHNPEYISKYSVSDGIGWGLAQWTWRPRKQRLYDYAARKGDVNKYLGDMDTQLEFLYGELTTDYSILFNSIKKSEDLYWITKEFMFKFENPFNQSDSAIMVRYGHAQAIYGALN
jgi:hypothetical protein